MPNALIDGVARSSTSIGLKLLPEVAKAFPPSAGALGLAPSVLLAVLVRNDGIRPDRKLQALLQAPRLVRQQLSCSLRSGQMAIARRRARQQGLSLNAYLESLIAAHLARPASDLLVLRSTKLPQ